MSMLNLQVDSRVHCACRSEAQETELNLKLRTEREIS